MSTSDGSPASRLVTLPDGIPSLTLGWEAARHATKYLRHPNGPRAGERWNYVTSQLRFLLWWYAVDEDGEWLYDYGVRRLSKGSGKSPFAAALALTEFTGPVRLKDFDPKAPGGCIGKPVEMPLVQIAATAESQTANTMRMVRAMARKGSRIVTDFDLDPGKTRYYKQPEGALEVITSSFTAAEGAEVTFAVGDETEHWTTSNGGHNLASTLVDNLTKSGSRMVTTCNAPVPGVGSVAEEDFDAWVAQEEGRTRGRGRILYDARVAPLDTDLADAEQLQAALEHVYDDCYWVKIEPIMRRIWSPKAKPSDSRRKYLNQPTAEDDAWITLQEFAPLHDPSRKLIPGEEVALFFDGSKSRDATALVGCCISDGHVFTLGVWEPDTSHDTASVVDVNAVEYELDQAFERFTVRGFYADVKEWESFTKVSWPEAYGDQLDVMAVPTGKDPQPIAWDMRAHSYEFGTAAELCEAEIREGAFTHDGNAFLVRHVTNARRAPSRGVVSIRKESPDSPRKIDAAVCMIGARMVRRAVLAAPPKKKTKAGKFTGF